MLVKGLDQGIFGPQATHHHGIVFVQRSQTVEESDEKLHDLKERSSR